MPYQATQNSDGTFNIHDVPIFAEMKAKERGNENAVGRTWMEAALKKAERRRVQDGYLAPAHIHHHGDEKPTRRAGFFMLTRVERTPYEGKPRWTLFADLVNVPPDVFAEIKSGALPYRSVEFMWDQPPEIHSLALMPDEVPFFRFELLTIADKATLSDKPGPERLPDHEAPAVAFAHAGARTMVLFRFREEQNMPDIEPGTDPGAKSGATIDDVLVAIAALPEAIVSALKGGEMGDDDGTPAEPEKLADDDDKDDDDEEMSAGDIQVAKLTARLGSVEEKLSARDAKDATSDLVTGALAELKAWNVTDSTRASIAVFAAQGKPVLDAFVTEFQRNTPKEPPATFSDMDAGTSEGDSAEVMKYTAMGPDKLAEARKADAQFRELRDTNQKFTVSRAQFLADTVGPIEGGEA